MKKLQKIALISVTLASLLSLNAVAQESKPNFNQADCVGKNCYNTKGKRGSYNKRGHHTSMMGAIRYLDLSKEQRVALRDLRKEQRDARRAYRKANRMQGKRGEVFVKALSKEGLNKEMLLTESTKQFQARQSRRIEHMEKVIKILTPEQRVELKKLLENKMKNRKEMGEKRNQK